MNKKNILFLIFSCLPFLVFVGFSTWIIMYEVEIIPEYYANPLTDYFGVTQETTYNGTEQVPLQISGETIYSSLISYEYKLETEETYKEGKPIWAGTYDIKITVQGQGTCTVKYNIKKKPIRLATPTVELNYFTGTDSKGNSNSHMGKMTSEINKSIKFIDTYNNEITTFLDSNKVEWAFTQANDAFGYDYITNGYVTFDIDSADKIPGSTYQVPIYLGEDITKNYEFTGPNYLIVKYKSAITNGIYYTIEDAIKYQNSYISFLGDSKNANTYVETQFCGLTLEQGYPYTNYTLETLDGVEHKRFDIAVTMYVPYDSSNTITNEKDSASGVNYVYAALTIGSGINLNMTNSKYLNVCGLMSGTMPKNGLITTRGVIMNNGRITVQSGSMIYAYGHIKGTGKVIMLAGSRIYDVMRFYDWPGGSDASGLVSKGFPIAAWNIHSVSCPTYIYKGASLYGVAAVEVTLLGFKKTTFCVINENTSGGTCLFRPSTSATSKDYIYKAGTNEGNTINTSITLSNQEQGQRDIIMLYGNYQDDSFEIKMSGANFSSGTAKPAPFSYADITVCSGSTMTISKSSYAFLAGTSLTVETNATVNIGSGAYIVFDTCIKNADETYTYGLAQYYGTYITNHTDALLKLNGTITGAGLIGGKVITEAEAAVLTVGTKITAITFREGIAGSATMNTEVATSSKPFYATGSIGNKDGYNKNLKFSDQSTTTFISTTLDGVNYFFTTPDDVKIFELNFFDPEQENKKLGTTTIYVIKPDIDGKYSYKITGNELFATKLHKDVDYWQMIDASSETGYSNAKDHVLYNGTQNTIDLYAVWKDHVYSFYFTSGYLDKDALDGKAVDVTGNTTFENIINTFTINDFVDDILNISTTATYEGKIFTGWFLGTMENYVNTEIHSITKEQLESFLDETGYDTIPIYCEFIDGYAYTLNFIENRPEIDCSSDNLLLYDQETIYLPDTSDFDSNPNIEVCFSAWYVQGETGKIYLQNDTPFVLNNFIQYADSNRVIKVEAEFTPKSFSVNYYNYNNVVLKKHYFNAGQTVYIYNGSDDDNYKKPDVTTPYGCLYTFDGWSKTKGGSVDYTANNILKENSSIDLYAHYSENYYYDLVITVDGAYVTINGVDYKSNDTIRYENLTSSSATVTISYVVTRTANRGLQVTQGGTEVCSKQTATYSGTYTLQGSHGSIDAKGTNDCISADSLITLYNGNQKRVDELTSDDLLLVWNHETGCFDYAPAVFLIHQQESEDLYKIINLIFSNGKEIKIIGEHGFFDVTERKYVYISENNINSFIGHSFLNTNDFSTISNIELVDYYVSYEVTKKYSPITYKHMNCFVDGILTITNFTNAFVNYFELDEEFKYDNELMKSDIEKYGLYTYDDWKDYMSYEAFLTFNGEYVKVSVGKGQTTVEEIIELIEMFLLDNNIIKSNSH